MIQQKQGGGTLIGLFIGLVFGVVIAAVVVWYMNKTPIPFQNKEQRPHTENANAAKTPSAPPAQVEALPGKPGDASAEKPRFEFYKILPGAEEAQPRTPPATAPTPQAEAPKKIDTLFLQAGAFQNAAEADNLKARLALMGIEASVEKVASPEKGTLHRVRIGPYATPEEMTRVRTQLAQNGIEAGVVRNKEGTH